MENHELLNTHCSATNDSSSADQFICADMKRFNYLVCEIDAAYHEAALKIGLSDSAALILYTICNYGDKCLLNDIIRLSGISKQTANSALRKLEAEKILYLESSGGRTKMVCLTDRGKALVQNTVLHIIEIENEIFGSWTEEERRAYLELTQRYLSSFRKKIGELKL